MSPKDAGRPESRFDLTHTQNPWKNISDELNVFLIMQVFPRWRNVLFLKNSITQSTFSTHFSSIHSTAAFFDKWKNKLDSDVKGDQQASKNYIRYSVKQKRSGTKKSLKSILVKGGYSTSRAESFSKIEADYAEQLNKNSRIKPARQAKRDHHKKKRKHLREDSHEHFDDDHYRFFHSTCGKQHGFTWTFKPPGMQFDRTDNYGWTNSRFNQRGSESGQGFGRDSSVLGTYNDRKILGLPEAGRLKIEDVKSAFRSSALKWHPDKHQNSSKGDAEEKFKHCVDAYKSLCNTLSTA